ncbi:conserved hypothetical protein [Arcobacter nitrofigilis DSM 7299]|uniref:DUF3108 domain-containing protein n=1 Tax=Arcobacter nitrofigilis (strain ATCC 33309 / DSM 7299 / CCUG 15893 / LMG 7604 / NCTC 12251 / CI) TaxID=572480 RepID=D5V565_ARCNC|nr:DUF3108 domain-containing protein [Arcobacter nitrofigilis]ADG93000.1 conserved hypothetical protein [Arcobacter nitrofigilis DSM 7299]
MNKIIIVIIFLSIFSNAKTFEATYKISYGIFGELGLAKTSLEILPNNTYKIKVHAYATGIAKFLSSNKEEFYESQGVVRDNLLIPNKYITVTNNDYKKRKKTYLFNYKKKQILVKKYEKKVNIKYDENLKKKESWKTSESKEFTNFFATNDLLSLFFNITKVVPSFEQGNSYTFKVIGANKDNGKLDIIIPKNKAYKELQEALNTKNKKFIVAIHQKNIFKFKRRTFYIIK